MRDPAPRFGSDVVRFGTAILFVLVLNVVQVFIVPRRLGIEAFGEYRVFLLYIGYLGVLHLGLVDGAFLRWVGRPLSVIRREWPIVLRRLALMQLPVLIAAVLAYAFATEQLTRTYLVAFGTCAVAANITAFASFTLQAAGDFQGAGRVTALQPALFAVAVVVLPLASLSAMLSTFVATYAISAVVGLGRLSGVTRAASLDEPMPSDLAPLSFREFVISGLPVLGAGIATGLSQYADRILVSLALPVAAFAFYGFASSAMALAGVARQTLSRVALTHAARRQGESRALFLDGMYGVIAACYGAALVGEPLFEFVVAHVLARYISSLAIVRALVPGALFWVATTVVVLGTLQTYGNVRRQFAVSVVCAVLAAVGAAAALAAGAPLWGIAAAASVGTVVAWFVGVLLTHHVIADARLASAWRFLGLVAVQSFGLGAALLLASNVLARTAICTLIVAGPTFVAARGARSLW